MSGNNFALTPQPPSTFTYLGATSAGASTIGGVLIGDYVNNTLTTPAGSNYNIPTVTQVAGVPVSAQLELQSTTGALLIMRMTTTQRNALLTVADGMLIYNTTSGVFNFRQGAAWVALSAGAGGVTGPGGGSTANAVARWSGTAGTALLNSLVIIDDSGNVSATNVSAGASGTAGIVSSFPATASTGSLRLVAVSNTGNTLTTISNVAMGQASVVSIPDPANAVGRFLVAATVTPFTSGHLVTASGTGGLVADAGFQIKSVAGAAAAGGAAAQSFTDAYCTSASNVIGNWNTQANPVSVLKIVPGTGSFVVTSSGDAGVGTFNYIITKV